MGGKKLTGWGKNGPAYFFPGERMGRPILSPGKKLTGGKFRPVTPGRDLTHTPGSAVSHVSAVTVRHVNDCAMRPCISMDQDLTVS